MLAAATRRTVSAARAMERPLLVAGLRAAAASVRPFAAVSTPDAESHDDFKPKVKASQDDPARLKAQVDQLVKSNKVVLFMKGTPQQPMCGFSMRVVQLLHAHGVDIHGVDILSNATLRTYMKEYSSWPTFPQLYVDGEFVGGCDIATQMHQNGELGKLLDEKAKSAAAAAGGAGASA